MKDCNLKYSTGEEIVVQFKIIVTRFSLELLLFMG